MCKNVTHYVGHRCTHTAHTLVDKVGNSFEKDHDQVIDRKGQSFAFYVISYCFPSCHLLII